MTQEPPFKVQIVPVTPFQQNCSIVRARTGEAAVIDPGGEVDRIMAAAEAMGADIKKIWLTHGHLDHASGAMELKARTGAPIEGAHPEEVFWLSQIAEQSKRFGVGGEGENVVPDRWLQDGDEVEIGGVVFDVYFTPGHTPGHVIFHQKDARLAFVGDVLFKGSIGRTDFPRGDHATLIRSITQKLWPLGNDTKFISGHGPMSSFGDERRTNPFVADHVLASSSS
jgi:glyoxylase-like metal-dependent hydrolase (beta-lactamase superfamily II)